MKDGGSNTAEHGVDKSNCSRASRSAGMSRSSFRSPCMEVALVEYVPVDDAVEEDLLRVDSLRAGSVSE